MENTTVKYLSTVETKKKGHGYEIIERGFMLTYSGMPHTERFRVGVGFLIHIDTIENVCKWKFVNERILSFKN